MKILVTGIPGSGKTTLVSYADNQNDDKFYDSDEIYELCEWRELKTGKVLGLVTKYKATDNEWYKKYEWYWNIEVLNKFLQTNSFIVLSGSSYNVIESYKYFDKIFILKKTEEELVSNLESPTRINPYGKTPEQRRTFMNWQNYLIKEVEKYNHTIIEGNTIINTYQTIKDYIENAK